MEYEYDPRKSALNKKKHGIDFVQAQRMWDDPDALQVPLPYADEERFMVIAQLGGRCWSAIATLRGSAVRIISVRKSRESEARLYEQKD